LVGSTWRSPNTYREAGIRRGTATSSSTTTGTTSAPASCNTRKRRMFIQDLESRIMSGVTLRVVYLAVDEPEGDLNSGEERLDSPKTYLHVRSYPGRHVRSYADNQSRHAFG